MIIISTEHKKYLKKLKINNLLINFTKLFIIISFLTFWEYLARKGLINTFLMSSPTEIIKTFINLFKENNLISHIWTTTYEVLFSFFISTSIGLFIASLMHFSNFFSKVIDPYLTVLNSLPKVSLGPLLIIWIGADIKSIILMAILISVFTTIINMYNAFSSTDNYKINLLKSFNATKYQIFSKLVLRGNLKSLTSTLKINISLCLIGVIMGELLVSKKGLGYLITYGSQIFNLNLVITSIFILAIISYILYIIVSKLELLFKK